MLEDVLSDRRRQKADIGAGVAGQRGTPRLAHGRFGETAVAFQIYLLDLRARSRRHWIALFWVFAPCLLALAIGLGLQTTKWPEQFAEIRTPYPLYILVGLLLWQSFAEAVLTPLRQFAAFRTELGRGMITVKLAVTVGVFDLVFATGLRTGLVLACVLVFGGGVSSSLLYAPVLLASLIGLGLAVGLLVALPGLLVEDIGRGAGFALAVGTLACPIFYPVSRVDVLAWNPLAALIDASRDAFTGQPVPFWLSAVALAAATVSLAVAIAWLRRAQPHFLNAIA